MNVVQYFPSECLTVGPTDANSLFGPNMLIIIL
jgi:hypothetical protein